MVGCWLCEGSGVVGWLLGYVVFFLTWYIVTAQVSNDLISFDSLQLYLFTIRNIYLKIARREVLS